MVTPEEKRDLLTKVGYRVDKEGYLVDAKTMRRVRAEDGKEIRLDSEKELALITESHTFVRDIAGFSHILVKKRRVEIEARE